MKKLVTLTVLSLLAVLIVLPLSSFVNHAGRNFDLKSPAFLADGNPFPPLPPQPPTLVADGNPFPPLPPQPPTLVADGNPFPPLPPPPGNAFISA